MATTTDLTTLKINYLTQAQYDTALENDQINDNELYFTPNEGGAAGGTPIPTADTVAEFDSDAHMNSEDMSAQDVSDFIDALTRSGANLIARISGQTLTFGNLKLVYVQGRCEYTSQITLQYPSSFSSTPWLAIPYCAQSGFGAALTASIVSATSSEVTIYQYNNASVAADVGAIVIGLA